MLYAILWEPAYIHHLKAIEKDLDRIEQALSGLYGILRRNPYTGQRVPNTDIYAYRLRIFCGLLPVIAYYRIRDDSHMVCMLAITALEE